jgi:hypothetical protein
MKLLLPIVMKRGHLREKLELLESNLREHQQIANLNYTYHNYAAVCAHTLLLWGREGRSSLGCSGYREAFRNAAIGPSQAVSRLYHLGPEQTGPRQVAQVVRDYFA